MTNKQSDPLLRLLIVDDEQQILDSLQFLLRRKYQITVASSGEMAWEKMVEGYEPQLVISDARMPKMQGHQLLAKIHQHFPNVVCIMLTGYVDIESLIQAINEGHIYNYVVKPWMNESLLLTMQKAAEYYRLQVSNIELAEELKLINLNLEGKVAQRTKELALRNVELETARKTAETLTRAKSDFLASISHEIRTPLNGIIVGAGLLDTTELNDEQDAYLSGIQRSSHEMMRLVSNILDFSKLEVNLMVLDERPYDVHLVLRDMYSIFRLEAAKRHNQLKLTVDPSVPQRLCGDQYRVKQVFSNLISNAIHFTESGRIEISLTCLDEGTESSLSRFQFKVSDTGCGIDQASMSVLFDKYRQGKNAQVQSTRGTGLGLSIAKQLAELMSGNIRVDSVLGKGSTFTVEFEQRQHAELDGETEMPDDDGQWHTELAVGMAEYLPLRILVAEDNRINSGLLLMLLEKLGYQATAVANGFEVLQAIEQLEYDVILMDINMPKMDGLETTRQIVEIYPKDKRPKIIAISASSLKEDVDASYEAGVEDYLCKPIQLDDIQVALSKGHDISQYQVSVTASGVARQGIVNSHVLGQYQEATVVKIAALFIRDMEQMLEKLPLAIKLEDADRLFDYCHSSKGVCLNLGAELLASKLERLLVLLNKSDFAEMSHTLPDLKTCFDNTKIELQRILNAQDG